MVVSYLCDVDKIKFNLLVQPNVTKKFKKIIFYVHCLGIFFLAFLKRHLMIISRFCNRPNEQKIREGFFFLATNK